MRVTDRPPGLAIGPGTVLPPIRPVPVMISEAREDASEVVARSDGIST